MTLSAELSVEVVHIGKNKPWKGLFFLSQLLSFNGDLVKTLSVGRSPSGKAPGFEPGIRRFDPYPASQRPFETPVLNDISCAR